MELVKLVRDAEAHPDSHEANVRPEDVDAWKANGWSVEGVPDGVADHDDGDGLTKPEIAADLEAMGVEFNPRASKADLLALRNEARAKRDVAE
ncbi:hypothetical protein [Synechococcus phage Ssp-JY42]|nr:hypothetical protein [Synechococcus phage Yong-M4-211]